MIQQKDLIREISKDTGYTMKEIQEILDTYEYKLILHARKDEKVRMLKGLIMYPGYRESKEYKVPWSPEKVTAAPHFTPFIRVTGAFRDKVNQHD